jgi:hypothetical protein
MLSNITSINLSLQTQGAAFVAREIAKLAQPARRLYVFGGASNVFPYFSTFANAKTYADAMTPAPSTTNPVNYVLLSDGNGAPIQITGASDWYALCLAGHYVSSPYREIFSTTTLPTTLPKGMRVVYVDANGTESLWVGNAQGQAWPAVGYKEYRAILTQTGTNAPVHNVTINTLGVVGSIYGIVGGYSATSSGLFVDGKTEYGIIGTPYFTDGADVYNTQMQWISASVIVISTNENGVPANGVFGGQGVMSGALGIYIRIYP